MKISNLRLFFAAPVFAISLAAGAAPNNIVQVFVSPNEFGGTGAFSQAIQLPGPLDLSGFATGGGDSSGSGAVHVKYGIVTMNGDSHGTLNTTVRGTFVDNITITAPGITVGTQGTVTFAVRVSGSLHATTGGSATTWLLSVNFSGGTTDISRTAKLYSPSFATGYVGDPFGTYSATVAFQFGSSTPLNVHLEGLAQAGFGANLTPGNCQFDGPLKANWEGISAVTLSNGQPVSNYTLISDSGTNWRVAIDVCTGDLNGDDQVDDADFIIFAAAYNILDCADPTMPAGCPADLNGDGLVDDSDFVLFVASYDALLCP